MARLHDKNTAKVTPDLMGALHDREAADSKAPSRSSVGAFLRRGMHLEMSLEEAALLTQKVWRGFANRARKDQLNLNAKLHLGYELHVLELRKKRKGLFIGFLQHMSYMALLVAVFFMQHGNTVNNRYVLVETLKSYVEGLKTPSGVQFNTIGSVADVWDWTENAFFEEFAGTSGRVYVRTYNQVIGSVGLTTTRVSDDSCEYRCALADNLNPNPHPNPNPNPIPNPNQALCMDEKLAPGSAQRVVRVGIRDELGVLRSGHGRLGVATVWSGVGLQKVGV